MSVHDPYPSLFRVGWVASLTCTSMTCPAMLCWLRPELHRVMQKNKPHLGDGKCRLDCLELHHGFSLRPAGHAKTSSYLCSTSLNLPLRACAFQLTAGIAYRGCFLHQAGRCHSTVRPILQCALPDSGPTLSVLQPVSREGLTQAGYGSLPCSRPVTPLTMQAVPFASPTRRAISWSGVGLR